MTRRDALLLRLQSEQKSIMQIPQTTLDKAVDFIIRQQNDDGGWSTEKGETSRMHYTYFAIWGLASYAALLVRKEHTEEASEKGVHWIMQNSAKNGDKALSISLDEGPSPTATALAILALQNIGKGDLTKPEWKKYLETTRRNGGWDEISDVSMVGGERRVYYFRSTPWIIEALVRSGEALDSETIREPLKKHKKFEVSSGDS